MKTLLTFLILPLIVLISVYYYTKEKADVRYVLSERIPIKISEGNPSESIQQLEVRNIGNREATQIQLIIKGNIVSYEILKYSKADTVKAFPSRELTEIIYPSLPPQTSFKLLITSVGGGLGKESLTVSHSQGKGREAFSENTNSSYLILITCLLYCSGCAWWLRIAVIDSLESKAEYDGDVILRRKKKPFYLNSGRWKSIRKKAIERKISRDKTWGSRDIINSQSYVLLNIDRPDYLEEEEWHGLVSKASEALLTMLSQVSMESHRADDVLNLLKVQRPRHFRQEDWDKLCNKISGIFVVMKKKDSSLRREDGLLNALKEERPDQVSEDTWSNYRKFLEQEYFSFLSEAMETIGVLQSSPIAFLKEEKLRNLSQEKVDVLRRRAYELQLSKLSNFMQIKDAEKFMKSEKLNWMKESDHKILMEKAKNIIDLGVQTRKYHSLSQALVAILNEIPISTSKPASVTDEDWQKVQKIEEGIRTCKLDDEKFAEDRTAVAALRVKIEHQLDIINNLLKDPTSIDRIEDYNNAFSPGNFENLRLLAKNLKAIL